MVISQELSVKKLGGKAYHLSILKDNNSILL